MLKRGKNGNKIFENFGKIVQNLKNFLKRAGDYMQLSYRINCQKRSCYVKCKIDKTVQSQLCRMCDMKSETTSHILRECEKLPQKECKKRHNKVARINHGKLCGQRNLKRSEKQYEHALEGAVKNEEVKIL